MSIMKRKKGFTLVEIITVVVLIGILVSIALPIYRNAVHRAKESVLKENLFQVRDAINKFYQDKKKYPTTLDELVQFKYLRKIPEDPIARTTDWVLVHFEPEDMEDFDPEIAESIIDVKSTCDDTASDGSKYSEW
jgi:general secretion pathway protein G